MAKKKKEEKGLIRREPGLPSTFEEMERDMARFFDEMWRRPFSMFGRPWMPSLRFPEAEVSAPTVDIFREGNDVVVKAELPGMTKEDIDVTLTDDRITISGEKKKEEKVEEKDYYRYERSTGSFTRSFHLPEDVQSDKAKAKFKNGILEIKIPMTEEAKKKEKKVEIE
ncbi:MAG: Hsp20/alpha crystallin family protein [Deltaproteobacteria bacterium]|nr:Hsp20/alpha crystallin family protein [Deltaproteobacteria bacterium]